MRCGIAVLVGVAAAAGAAGCGTREGADGPGSASGGPLTVLTGPDIDSLDPGQVYEPFTATVIYATQRRLFDAVNGAPGRLRPDLAAGPADVRDGGRTIVVHMRRGVRYSPPLARREVRAQDLAYALRRAFSRAVANGYAAVYFGDIAGAPRRPTETVPRIAGIRTPDDHTLVLRLRRPAASVVVEALQLPVSSPVPEEYAARFDRHAPSTYRRHVVFTGPYRVPADPTGRLTGYRSGHDLTLVRNPSWRRVRPGEAAAADRIQVRFGFDDTAVASRKITAGRGLVQGNFFLPQSELVRVMRRTPELADRIPTTGVEYLGLRMDAPPLRDLHVRRAIAAAVDRATLLRLSGGPLAGRVATRLMPPEFTGGRAPAPGAGRPDTAAVRRELAAASLAARRTLAGLR